jgi:hypothetical protein
LLEFDEESGRYHAPSFHLQSLRICIY